MAFAASSEVLRLSHDPEVASAWEKLVRSIMAELGLEACRPRAYKATTQPDPDAAGPVDLVGQNFTAEQPGMKLVDDITYIRTLKNELAYRTAFPTRAKVRPAVADYIEVFYNRVRLHSGLSYTTPAEARAMFHQNSANAAKHIITTVRKQGISPVTTVSSRPAARR